MRTTPEPHPQHQICWFAPNKSYSRRTFLQLSRATAGGLCTTTNATDLHTTVNTLTVNLICSNIEQLSRNARTQPAPTCGADWTHGTFACNTHPTLHSWLMFWYERNCASAYKFSTVLALDESHESVTLFSFQHRYEFSAVFQALVCTQVDTLTPHKQDNPLSPGRSTRVSSSGCTVLAHTHTEWVITDIAHTVAHAAPIRSVCGGFIAIVTADFSVHGNQLVHAYPLSAFRRNSNAGEHNSGHSRYTLTSSNALWHVCLCSTNFDFSHAALTAMNISGRQCLDTHQTGYVFLHIPGYARLLLTMVRNSHNVYGTTWSTRFSSSRPNVHRVDIQLHGAVHGIVITAVCFHSGCRTRNMNVLAAFWYTNTCSFATRHATTSFQLHRQTTPSATGHRHVFHCTGYTLHANYICLGACDSFYISKLGHYYSYISRSSAPPKGRMYMWGDTDRSDFLITLQISF
jgi:hypothetical protein